MPPIFVTQKVKQLKKYLHVFFSIYYALPPGYEQGPKFYALEICACRGSLFFSRHNKIVRKITRILCILYFRGPNKQQFHGEGDIPCHLNSCHRYVSSTFSLQASLSVALILTAVQTPAPNGDTKSCHQRLYDKRMCHLWPRTNLLTDTDYDN